MKSKKMTLLLRLAQRARSKLLSTLFPYTSSPEVNDNDHQPTREKTSAEKAIPNEALVLASQLHGKTFHLPDLWKVFSDWPLAANRHAKRLEGLVDTMLERIITNERKLKALKQADFGRLISL